MSRGRTAVHWLQTVGTKVHEAAPGWRGAALAGAELLGLSALVVAQPVFDAMQRSTYAFGAAGARGFEVVLLALALVLLPPALMLAVELLAQLLSRSLRGWVHLLWIGLLVSLFCWQAVKQADASSHLLYLAIPALGFAAASLLYVRFAGARSLLRYLAFAAPVVTLLFLFTSPISSFTLPGESDVPGPKVDSKTPVVVVVFDELPLAGLLDERGRIDAQRFPNFAALARHSDWFRNALTVADTTELAVPAILTGDFPKPNGLSTYSDHPRNLFTLLGSSYETNISESGTSLCPPTLCAQRGSLIDRLTYLNEVGFETADSFPFDLGTRVAGELESGRPGAIVPGEPDEQVSHFLKDFVSPPGGSLNLIHVELPHIPYQYMPSGQRYRTIPFPIGILGTDWPPPDQRGFVIQGMQRMLLQLRYTDKVLGQVVARMRKTGLFERAMLAVTADHGASFIPGVGRRLVTQENAGWILRVPLFVKLPGQRRGRIISRPVRTIDLVPTIADVLGIDIPWPVGGRSLLKRSSDPWKNTYMSSRDEIVHVPAQRVKKDFFAAMAVRNGFFGRGNLFTMGASRRELSRELRGAKRLDFTYQSPGSTSSNYDRSSGTYPSLVYGRFLDPPSNPPGRLIVTLNGRPVAVAESVDQGAGFATLIPPSAFHPGPNRLQVYAPR